MTFEFDLEVRPEFDLPKWKGLTIEKPVRELDRRRRGSRAAEPPGSIAAGNWCRSTDAAEPGDYITVNLTFKHWARKFSPAPPRK